MAPVGGYFADDMSRVGEDGKLYVRPALVKNIRAFSRVWDRNLKHQGFVEAAGAGACR
jgi:hypothetical protein